MTITASLTTGQITLFAIVICVIEVIKIILLIWLVSALSKIKRHTRLHANRTGQLCKLTADTQIITRGIFKKLTENDVEEDYLPKAEEKSKKTRKKTAVETKE